MKMNRKWMLCALFLLVGDAIAQSTTAPPETQHAANQAATLRNAFFSSQSYRVKSDLNEALSLSPEQKKAMQAADDEVMTPIFLEHAKRGREERESAVKPTDAEKVGDDSPEPRNEARHCRSAQA